MAVLSFLFNVSLDVLLSLGYAGIFYLMALDSMMVPAASEAVLILAGVLSYMDRFNLLTVIIVATVASLVGSTVSWLIGKYGGRKAVEKYGHYLLIRREDIERGDAFFRRHGDLAVFVGRIIPLVRTYISLPAGIALMGYRRFILFTFAGTVIFVTVLAAAGYEIGRNLGTVYTVLGYLNDTAAAVVLAAVVLLVLYLLRSGRRARFKSGN
ncbi:MAG: DedA family protein [Candidatus Thermoplasmatota archaeon]|nr:DedA family protein [Candidatus Thermoplasmatota archaeon]